MRVLLVSQRFPPGRVAGAELQVKLLAGALARRGLEVEVLTTREPGKPPPEEIGTPITAVPVLGAPLRQVSQWGMVQRHLRSRRDRFDLVHCHCISPASLAALQVFGSRGTPRLLQPSLGGSGGEFERARVPLLGPYLTRIIRSADAYAVLDPSIGDQLRALGIDPGRLIPARNGIDLGQFRPGKSADRSSLRSELGLPTGPLVLFVGQLVERKGVHDLLATWPDIASALPGATLALVGSGPLARRVQAAAERDPSLLWLGERRDISRLMQAAELLALPSYNESFGCALLEALACGLPVVAGQTGIAAQLGVHGIAGTVIQPGDRSALGRAIVDLLADDGLRQHYADAGPALARSFDIDSVAAEFAKTYRRLAG